MSVPTERNCPALCKDMSGVQDLATQGEAVRHSPLVLLCVSPCLAWPWPVCWPPSPESLCVLTECDKK